MTSQHSAWLDFHGDWKEAGNYFSATKLADAISHAIASGYCDGDPSEAVSTTGDREFDHNRLVARRIFKLILHVQATDFDEARYIAEAIVHAPVEWRARRFSDRTIRDALAAAEFARYGTVTA